jgi:predicted O-linked N-acetylglucosamine transferase (SPINDLY family)
LASYDQALAIQPNLAKTANNRGVALEELGRYEEALASYDRALALKPDYAEALDNRGNVLQELGRFEQAVASYDSALAVKPDFANALVNRGNAFKRMGRLHDAEMSFRRVLAKRPDEAAYSNLGSVLQTSGRLAEAVESYRRALALKPDFAEVHSNLIFALDLSATYGIEEQQQERRRWHERHGRRHSGEIHTHRNAADPDRPLRVGYVSADFRAHSAYYAFSPVILSHDRAAFEIYCYSGVKRADGATARLQQAVPHWRSTLGFSDDALAGQIRADAIDILVDLSGHTAGNRLLVFARKPAPVQITAWGHATGTGLETMDYLLADPVVLPKQHRHLFAEEIIDLPCAFCYQAPDYAPAVQPLPASGGRPFTFGCINRVEKISDSCIELWGEILAAVPAAGLLLKHSSLQDARLQESLLHRLSAFGIGVERVRLFGASPHADHLQIYHQVDVGLDPFPNNGGISTAEALWMGVPVVTLPGQGPGSRSSAAILTAVRLESWIARDTVDYVRIARNAAADTAGLAALRQRLRPMMAASAYADPGRYTAAVERAYRAAWRRWCQSRLAV